LEWLLVSSHPKEQGLWLRGSADLHEPQIR